MGSFVTPAIERLMIQTPDGEHWVDVKRRLNAGEQQDFFESIRTETGTLRPARIRQGYLLAYLLDWSLTDDRGQAVPVSEGAIRNLDPDVFQAIGEAVEAHDAVQQTRQEARKNVRSGDAGSKAISTSAV